jgi:hypothetical protein
MHIVHNNMFFIRFHYKDVLRQKPGMIAPRTLGDFGAPTAAQTSESTNGSA